MQLLEHQPVNHKHRQPRGSVLMPILVTILAMIVLAGTVLALIRFRVETESSTAFVAPVAVPSSAPVVSVTPETDSAVDTSVATTPDQNMASGQAAGSAGPAETATVNAISTENRPTPFASFAQLSTPQQIELQLAAGEFGPALENAQRVQDKTERSALLARIAEAQLEAGEFQAALGAINRMPLPEQRRTASRNRHARKAMSGGAAAADFDTLIQLIMQETSGPWFEIDGEGGTMSQYPTGVLVEPNGMLATLTKQELNGRLQALGIKARKADLNDDMAKTSPLRLVSLTRLDREISDRLANGQPVPESMLNFAGLTQVRYVFVYPESGEIIVAGPAEAWQYDERGLPVGSESQRPTLQLDDFITLLRTFVSHRKDVFSCLIVPRQEGLKKVKSFVEQSQSKGPMKPGQVRKWVENIEQQLGMQDVVFNNIATDSRVARVIIEADYRMKLIGVGKLDGGKIPSFFDLLTKQQATNPPALDALRWWLTMQYDAVLHSADRNVFEFVGSSVLCRSENELITDEGKRIHTGKAETTNRLFAQEFTKNYAQLAERDIVFADLQNIFDLALVAALIRHERLHQRTNWDLGVFDASSAYTTAQFEPATTVMSVSNHRVYNGKDIVVQVAGGVRADLMSVLNNPELVKTVDRLKNVRQAELPAERWWWDSK